MLRKGYVRHGYTRSDGTVVKSTYVKPLYAIPKLEKGKLKKYGYTTHEKKSDRMRALKKAVNDKTYASIIRELNAIAILNKNMAPRTSEKIRNDMSELKKLREHGKI